MKRTTLDLWVGLFAALGCAASLFLALRAANLTTSMANEPYTLYAEFDNIGGLKVKAPVKMAGVVVGRVAGIELDRKSFRARATLVGALVVEDRLWGLVSCQHKDAAWYAGAVERDVFGELFKDIAGLIEAAQVREQLELEHTLAQRRRTLVQAIRSLEFKELMRIENNADLLGVVEGDGFALVVDSTMQTTGATPSVKRVQE